MATRDPEHPDTTEAVAASRWIRLGEVLKEARDIIVEFMVDVPMELDRAVLRRRAMRWLDEYDAHQIPTQEPQP